MANLLSDHELLAEILDKHAEHITGAALNAFTGWRDSERVLTDKQKKWLYGVADRLGIQVAPSENIFSSLPPGEQKRQRDKAKGILPWEK